jgi:UDPglucose--hexose-1-phosphate uridylyltransferase
MPELRKDPVIDRWVIIAQERAKRPIDHLPASNFDSKGFCPLCPGHEEKTTHPVYTILRKSETGSKKDWRLRVVLNKFPALVNDGNPSAQNEGIYEIMDGIGAHEVVVETPDHHVSMADYDDEQMRSVIIAYRERILTLSKDSRFRYILIFKNYGMEAGASLSHPHSQIIALPIVPKRVSEEMKGVHAYKQKNNSCVYCEMIQQERATQKRIVLENDDFIAIEPFAARFPFETWILPKQHETNFEFICGSAIDNLTTLLRDVLWRIKQVLHDPPYNFMLHTSPQNDPGKIDYHWHLEITPKLTKVAGFEWGTGFYINPMPPETAADLLNNY